MGSGASFDAGIAGGGDRFFCHSCHRVFGLGGVDSPQDYYCPHCQSTFLEALGDVNHGQISVRHRSHGELTLEQTRRISNATAMLRLLEAQLRDELEHLQHAFETANFRIQSQSEDKKKKLTAPSCPICSEEFILGTNSMQLPCSHLFHAPCVMPWLEMKQNCPICRADLPDFLPTLEELESLTANELKDKLTDLNVNIEDFDQNSSLHALASLLHRKLVEAEEREIAEDSVAATPSLSISESRTNIPRFRAGILGYVDEHPRETTSFEDSPRNNDESALNVDDQPAAINASTASQSLRSLVFSNPSNVDQHRGVSFMFPSRADGNDERTEFRSLSTDHVSLQRRHGGSGSTVTYMVLSRDGAGGNSIVRASNND